jgi:tripartite-type tricarboxylate transporter receptor subunit TctC
MLIAAMRRYPRLSAALAALMLITAAAAETAYPERPVRVIVPYPPGGAVDAVARITGVKLSEELRVGMG